MTNIPNDPLFAAQWYLNNTGQLDGTPGVDLNVLDVWDDYSGEGVTVGVFDDGFDYIHPDLDGNYNSTVDYDYVAGDTTPLPSDEENHGTAVAGIIGAEANGIGGVGVAYNSTLVGFRIIGGENPNELNPFVNVDVANNSWGYSSDSSAFFFDDFNSPEWEIERDALIAGVRDGRDGLGTAIVFAAGNEREVGDNTNYHNFTNSPYVITVGALLNNGVYSPYSTPGASILVSAFGSESGGIVTTDRRGADGYDTGDYTDSFNGTSAATPMVSGVVALMLEANPDLGYRDIQEILAYSAIQNNPTSTGWQFNGANNSNGGGLHVNHDYGFGLVDARAAVRLAETWRETNTFENRETLVVDGLTTPQNIPDLGEINSSVTVEAGLEIDSVEVALNIDHTFREDIRVTLISPNGTESVLIDSPTIDDTGNNSIDFVTSSTHYRGEDTGGTWTLRVEDLAGEDLGKLVDWSLKFTGDTDSPLNDTYFYTDEFVDFTTPSRTTLNDTAGVDKINAAAITSDISLNLAANSTNNLAGNTLTIGSNTVIENAVGGDGDDSIAGNSVNNALSGMRGSDLLIGGAGNDTLSGSYGNVNNSGVAEYDNLTGGTGADLFVLGNSDAAYYLGESYVTIDDFNVTQGDRFLAFGTVDDYTQAEANGGINLYYQDDLIARLANTTDSLGAGDFNFV
jgi:subtilisin-like proprotein convertase family protein